MFVCIDKLFTLLPFPIVQYELEREKLEMELEEERKSQKERDQCIREQQIKIDNLSSLVTTSDFHGTSIQVNTTHFLVLAMVLVCFNNIFVYIAVYFLVFYILIILNLLLGTRIWEA